MRRIWWVKYNEWVRNEYNKGTCWWNRVSIVNYFGSIIIANFFLKNIAKGIIMWTVGTICHHRPSNPSTETFPMTKMNNHFPLIWANSSRLNLLIWVLVSFTLLIHCFDSLFLGLETSFYDLWFFAKIRAIFLLILKKSFLNQRKGQRF